MFLLLSHVQPVVLNCKDFNTVNSITGCSGPLLDLPYCVHDINPIGQGHMMNFDIYDANNLCLYML